MTTSLKYYLKRSLHRLNLYQNFTPKKGNINFGDLHRTTPLSRRFGYDRGGPVDRVYIENFLQVNSQRVKGRVLEVANNTYTKAFGGANVLQSDILHVVENYPGATIIADLGKPIDVDPNQFDCIILTQTLQFIYDYEQAIKNCHQILKPGGYLLLTVPGISHIGKDPWNWYWSFTKFSIQRILADTFGEKEINVEAFGNVLTASAFLYGMGKSEIKKDAFEYNDPSYQVIVTATARKSN